MNYNNGIIDLLLLGNYPKAINAWKRNLQKIIKLDCSKWSFSQFNNIYSTINYILNSDPFIKGVIKKRIHLIKSYDYQTDIYFEGFIQSNLDIFYNILYNIIFYNKCLVYIANISNSYKIQIIDADKYYVKDGEIIFLTDDEYDINSLLYFGEELFDIGMLGLSLVIFSITKEHNYNLWYNNNIYLNGFLHSSISTELSNEINTTNNINGFSDKLINELSNLPETSGLLNTPSGIEIAHKDIVNTNVGNFYQLYIEQIRKEIEDIILGRSTQQNDTSYASEKVRYLSTLDIQYSDIKELEKIVNNIVLKVKSISGKLDLKTEFKIVVAADEDELSSVQVLNGLNNLNAIDTKGNPLMVESEWIRDTFRIPIKNNGLIRLSASTAVALPQNISNNINTDGTTGEVGGDIPLQNTALNGAQVSSLLQIIESVTSGILPKESAVSVIQASFPDIAIETINHILNPITINRMLL